MRSLASRGLGPDIMPIPTMSLATRAQIEEFEKAHGIVLPRSYRDFLLEWDERMPEPNCLLDGDGHIRAFLALLFPLSDESMFEQCFAFDAVESGFVVAGTNGGGDYFLVDIASGGVYYWDHEVDDIPLDRDALRFLASSPPELVKALRYAPGDGPEEPDEIERLGRDGTPADLDAFLKERSLESVNAAGRTVAHEAARYENVAMLRRCLDLGCPTEGLLHLAAQGEDRDAIVLLLERGLDVNALDDRGRTPLDRVISPETYEFLLSRGAVHRAGKPPHLR